MATQANWELDPETRTKLAALQKKEGLGNDRCCDCGAPSPQWASPKFAIFICLQCAGTHRGLGVHISFVRSISMDAFKATEIKRMQLGGNKAWQDFFNGHPSTTTPFEDLSIKERYDSEAGEEYKERLAAKAEDREFDETKFKRERAAVLEKIAAKQAEKSRSGTPMGRSSTNSRTQSPATGRGAPGLDPTQKAKNEAFFEKMGNANASRPEGLAPSHGGKYAGFGSSMPEPANNQPNGGIPGVDDFQRDPVAALTRGFGWLSSTVTKQAKTINESYIAPTAKNLAQTDFAAQAQKGFQTVSTGVAQGAKGGIEQFHKFVEGQDNAASNSAAVRSGSGSKKAEPERKDFWDSFGVSDDPPAASTPSSIGTSAMKKPAAGGDTAAKKKKDDGWGNDW